MRRPILLLLLMVMAGCETTKNPTEAIPKQNKTRIVFNTSDILYAGGLGDAGVDGFCKRIQTYLTQDLAEHGITAVTSSDASASETTITVTIATIEPTSGAGFNGLVFFNSQKIRAKYSAVLASPAGATLATWKHEVDEDSPDKLSSHMAADITKYLKKGFK